MTNSIYYSLNHIPLMMTWAYCYNEILPVRKSYWRDYLTLDLSITLAVFVLLHIYALPGSVQDNAVVRMTVSAAVIGLPCEAPGVKSNVICAVCSAAAFDHRGNGDDADHADRRAVQPQRV